MFQKILQIFGIALFFIVFGYFFGDEYWDFQEEKKQETTFQSNVQENKESFTLESISNTQQQGEFLYTPYLGLLDNIVEQIDNAEEKIYVEIYIFTETQMRDAMIRAYKRGVDVKILMENNPYKAPYLNDKHYNAFKEAGIDVRWSDPLNYSLNHSKLLIIDDITYVSTGNFSYSLFKYNRDFLIKLPSGELSLELEELFLGDYNHKKGGVIHKNIILSPEYSRSKLELLISQAKESIDFYFPYISDTHFEEILFIQANSGIKIKGIVDKEYYKENTDVIKKYKKAGIEIHALEKSKLHAKAILVDGEYLYVGSINFSSYSFDENREIGLLLSNEEIIGKFQRLFESDF